MWVVCRVEWRAVRICIEADVDGEEVDEDEVGGVVGVDIAGADEGVVGNAKGEGKVLRGGK